MNYLERNAALVAEINDEIEHGLVFNKKWVARSISGTMYSTLGSYSSEVLGRHLYLGLKEYDERKEVDRVFTMSMTLAILRKIIEEIPEYESEIPVLHGRLRHRDREDLGIIVEDISKGGTLSVHGVNPNLVGENELPDQLTKVNPYLDKEDLASITHRVGKENKRMLLDVLGMRRSLDIKVLEVFHINDIVDEIESHTVYTSQKV